MLTYLKTKKMRNWLQFFPAIIIICFFSCKGNDTFTVGYLNPSADRYRFVTEGKFMQERLKELGVKTIELSAGDNDIVQLEQGYELLKQGVDLLIIAPVNGTTIAPLVRDAMDQGVKVVAYNRLINNARYDLFVTGDNEDNAKLFCNAALTRKPVGNYVVFAGDRFDRNGFELKQHIDSILKPHVDAGRVKILYETYIEGWNRQRASFEMEQVVSAYGTNIDAVISCNDPMGLGAYDVLKKYNAEKGVVITGQDATLAFVKGVYNGDLTMTIYHPHKTLGYKTAELIASILNGEKWQGSGVSKTFNGTEYIPTYKIKSVAVTRENLEEVLIKSGQYSLEEIKKYDSESQFSQ